MRVWLLTAVVEQIRWTIIKNGLIGGYSWHLLIDQKVTDNQALGICILNKSTYMSNIGKQSGIERRKTIYIYSCGFLFQLFSIINNINSILSRTQSATDWLILQIFQIFQNKYIVFCNFFFYISLVDFLDYFIFLFTYNLIRY